MTTVDYPGASNIIDQSFSDTAIHAQQHQTNMISFVIIYLYSLSDSSDCIVILLADNERVTLD